MRSQRHPLAAFYPRERPGIHCTGSWVGPRAGLDRCGKSRPPPGFDPRTVQPVASRYTDYDPRATVSYHHTKFYVHKSNGSVIHVIKPTAKTGSPGHHVAVVLYKTDKSKWRWIIFKNAFAYIILAQIVVRWTSEFRRHLLPPCSVQKNEPIRMKW